MFNSAIYPKNLVTSQTSIYMNMEHLKYSVMITIKAAIGLSYVNEKKKYYSAGDIAGYVKRFGSFDHKDALVAAAFLIQPVGESYFDVALTVAHPGNPVELKKPKFFDMDLAALILTDVFAAVYPLKTPKTADLFELVDDFLNDFKEDVSSITSFSEYTHEQLSRRMVKNLIRVGDGDDNYSQAMFKELQKAIESVHADLDISGISYPAELMALAVYPKLKNPYRTATWLFREYVQNNKRVFKIRGNEDNKGMSLSYAVELVETLWLQCAKDSSDTDSWPIENLPNTYFTYSTPLNFPLMNFEKVDFKHLPMLKTRFASYIVSGHYLWKTSLTPVEAMNGMAKIYREADYGRGGGKVFNMHNTSPLVGQVLGAYFGKSEVTTTSLRQYKGALCRYINRDNKSAVNILIGPASRMALNIHGPVTW